MAGYEHSFRWATPGASTVVVTGTFDNWTAAHPLKKQDDGSFAGDVKLPYAQKVLYKYVVDGNWVCGPDQQTEDDGRGNVNNVLQPKAEPAAAAKGGEPEPVSPPGTESTTAQPATTAQTVTSTFNSLSATAAATVTGLFGAVTGAASQTSSEKPPEPASTPAVPEATTKSLPTVPSGERIESELQHSPEPTATGTSALSPAAPRTTTTPGPVLPQTPGDPVENAVTHLGQAVIAIPAAALEAITHSNAAQSASQSVSNAVTSISNTNVGQQLSETLNNATTNAANTNVGHQVQAAATRAADAVSNTTGIPIPAALGGPGGSFPAGEHEPKPSDVGIAQRTPAGATPIIDAKADGAVDRPAPAAAAAGAGAASSSAAPPAPELPSLAAGAEKDADATKVPEKTESGYTITEGAKKGATEDSLAAPVAASAPAEPKAVETPKTNGAVATAEESEAVAPHPANPVKPHTDETSAVAEAAASSSPIPTTPAVSESPADAESKPPTNGTSHPFPDDKPTPTPPATPSKKEKAGTLGAGSASGTTDRRSGSRFSTFRRASKPPSTIDGVEHGRDPSGSSGGEELGSPNGNGTGSGDGKGETRKRKDSIFGRIKSKLSPSKSRKERESSAS